MERFWEKVKKGGRDECWEWQACRSWNGYGKFGIAYKTHYAHRVAWTLTRGSIPDDLHCCHSCDNKVCVNPRHLFLGTREDNMQDASRKGRMNTPRNGGVNNGRAKLTEEEVKEIRELVASGMTQQVIADAYGVCQGRVSRIHLGLAWARP